ncbi:Protein lap4 isoform 1 [Schistosoma japonicum]|uniref:Protein lap4 isoform 1 n=1 Tax=Schistosoma japonicum TaxID=6182 RepID=A0A4Z2D962_SCHJA|nr:Protein lap4 isoform 1 [Schistosoma japonicum]
MFKCLPIIGPCGRHIDHIDRRHSKLEQVPDDVIRNFRTLEECRLDANQIKELPKNFFRLKRIRLLTLSDNELTRLPTGIGSFSNLVELDISRNDISELPESIRFCDSLQSLDVSNNPLQSLPSGFCQLRNLRVLCLNDISIAELPEEIGSLQLLEKLELRDNCLKTIPDSFADLINLEFLDLGANEFQELSPVIGQLSQLSELWIDDNELRSLPKELGNLGNLQQLDISENLISSLPESISGLVSLSDLNISQNSITHLPDGLGDLNKLIILKLNQNRLLTVTPTIGKCSSLQELYLTENFLSKLPSSIGSLVSMFHLNVDQNQLTELPSEIGQCTSLNILSLRENNLHRLPDEIGDCTRLRVLDVSGNRLDRLPFSLSRCSLTALWLSQNQSQPVITLQKDIDPVTQEQYLTCYLLPQDQLDSRVETDPTMSPSELDSFSASVNPDTKPSHDLLNGISAEINHAYDPTDMHTLIPQSDLTNNQNIFPSKYELMKPRISPSSTLSGNSTMTDDPSSLKHTPVVNTTTITTTTTTNNHPIKKLPYSNSLSAVTTSRNVDQTYTPLNHSNNISTSSTQSSLSMPTSASTRVHFSGSSKPDEMDKSASKGFPKTRHPRSGKKATDNHFSSKGDPNHYENANTSSKTFSEAVSLASSSESLNDHYNDDDNAAQILISESLNHDHKSPKPINSNFYSSVYPHNVIKSSDMNSITTNNGDHITIGPIAKPRNKSQNITEAFDKKPSPSSPNFPVEDTTSKLSIGIGRPKLPIDSVIRTASEEDTSDSRSNRASPVKKFADTLDVRGNPDEDAYSSGGEEIYVISRRVGFTDDVEDNEEKSNQKLIRRDTPHYTKRARIQSKTADGVDSEEAVLKILEKYRASVSPNPDLNPADFDGTIKRFASSFNGALISPDIPLHNRDSHSPSSLHGQPIVTLQEKVEVHIHRQPNAGLGLSVAGGVGSIPFRGLDHGIFVSRLNPNGLAATSGLKLGDKLLEVNGVNLVNVEHHVAVAALRANTNYFRILVTRDIQASSKTENCKITNPTLSGTNLNMLTKSQVIGSIDTKRIPEFIHCILHRDSNGLGFSIAGGQGSLPPPLDNEINGIDVRNARHDEAISLLIASNQSVDLEILRYNSDENDNLSSLAKTSANGYITPPSVLTIKGSNDLQNIAKTTDVTSANDCTSEKYDSRVYLYNEKGVPVERITIRNDGGPLGLAICGGSDISCLPFGDKEPGIFISKISPDGAALNTGLRIGDRVLKVNGVDLRHATHDEAVQALIQPVKELQLEVRRDPPPPGLRRITVTKRPGERYGLRITGGLNTNDSSMMNNFGSHFSSLTNDDGIFVTWVSSDGVIARDGRLKPGDRLLEINGHWLMGVTLDEVLHIFREAKSILSCVVCDGPVEFALQISKTQSKNDESSTYSSAMPFTIIRSSMLANADASVDDNLTFNSQIEKASIYRLNPEAIIRD